MQERLTRLLDASPAVIYSFKARDDFAPIFVSDNIEALFGYAPREYLEEPEFLARARASRRSCRGSKPRSDKLFDNGKHALEYRFRRKDGSYCWVSDEQHLIRDEKGEPLEIVGSWSDITARKKAEEAEDAVQARLALLLETAPAVIYSFKASGDYAPTFVSENIKRLLGYCPDKYLKNADFWRKRVHPDDLPQVEAEQVKVFEQGPPFRRIPLPQYRRHLSLAQRRAASDPRREGRAARDRRLVERHHPAKAAEQAEDALKARMALLLESAPAVVYSFKATGDFAPTFISENVKRVLGYCPDEYLKNADFWRVPRPS